MDQKVTLKPVSIPLSPPPVLFINAASPQNKPIPSKPLLLSTNLPNMILLNNFTAKNHQPGSFSGPTLMKIKSQPSILPKRVKPIASKVPQGKMPISPAPWKFPLPHLKSPEISQTLYLKQVQCNAESRKGAMVKGATVKGTKVKGATVKGATVKGTKVKGSKVKGATVKGTKVKGSKVKGATVKGTKVKDGSCGSFGNILLPSNNLFSSTLQKQNPGETVMNNQVYLMANRAGLPGNQGATTNELNHSLIINSLQIHNNLPRPLRFPLSPTPDCAQHLHQVSCSQKLPPSKFVPIKPKLVLPATPDLLAAQKFSTAFDAVNINNFGLTSPNKKYRKTRKVKNKNGWSSRKSQKKVKKSMHRLVNASHQAVDSDDIFSEIQVKIERVDSNYDDILADDKNSAISASENPLLRISNSKFGSCADGLKRRVRLGIDSYVEKSDVKIQPDKVKTETERNQLGEINMKPLRHASVTYKDNSACFYTDKEQTNSNYNTCASLNGLSVDVKSEEGQRDHGNNAEDSYFFQAVIVKSEPVADYDKSICSFEESAVSEEMLTLV